MPYSHYPQEYVNLKKKKDSKPLLGQDVSMEKIRFEQKIKTSLGSFKNLKGLSRSSLEPLSIKSVEGCPKIMEELNTAGEELRRQDEEMAATRQALEDERPAL